MTISAFVVGNVGADPETRFTNDGTAILSFSVASNRRTKDGDVTTWVRCSLFGKRGEGLAKVLAKGSSVWVRGELSLREYEKDGAKRTSVELRADDVGFAGSKRDGAQQRPAQGGGYSAGATRRPAPADAGGARLGNFEDDRGPAPGGDDDDLPF